MQWTVVAIATHCPRPAGAGEEAGGRVGWGLHASLRDGDRGGGMLPPVSPSP